MRRGLDGERRSVGVVGVGGEKSRRGREEKLIGCVVGVGSRESGDSLTRSPACDVVRPCGENSRRSCFLRELISDIVGKGVEREAKLLKRDLNKRGYTKLSCRDIIY